MEWSCPNGHGTFEEGQETCPDCGAPLAGPAAARAEAGADDGRIVYLATASNELVADLWVQGLREAGIKAMAKPLGPGFGAWASAFTLEHALYVLEGDLEAAREVLSGLEGLDFDDESPGSPFRGRRR